MKQDELETILRDLADSFLLEINEDIGEGGSNVYRAYQWSKPGVPRSDEYTDLFVDCVDPIGVSSPDGGRRRSSHSCRPEPTSVRISRRRLRICSRLRRSTRVETLGSSGGDQSDGSEMSSATDKGDTELSAYGGGVEDEPKPVELNPWTEVVLG